MITEIDLSQYYIKKEEIRSAFQAEANADAATVIKNAINAKPNLGTSHNDAARGDHNHDGVYLKSYNPPIASTSSAGIVQLNTSTNNASTNQAATPSAVQSVYNLANSKSVSITKKSGANATSGYLITYEISQGGTLLGKIDIPKDFLVRSGTIKTAQASDLATLGSAYEVGDKYIDLVINVNSDTEADSHIYINLKDLVEAYYADNETLQLSSGNVFSIKANGIKSSHIASGQIQNNHIASNTKIDFSKLNITSNDLAGMSNPPFSSNTHTHGSINIDGVIDDDIQGVYRVVVTNNNREIKTANKIPTANLTLPDGTTAQKGIVQLNDSTESTSTTTAATPNAVRQAYTQASHSHPYISTDAGSVGTSNLARRSVTNDKLKPTAISAPNHLDNMTTAGFYACSFGTGIGGKPNLGESEASPFTLMVISGTDVADTEYGLCSQIYTCYDNTTMRQYTRHKIAISSTWSPWVLSASSDPVVIESNDYFKFVVNPVGRTASVMIWGEDKNFGSKLTNNKIVRFFKRNGSLTDKDTDVIGPYKPKFPTSISFSAWKTGLVGRVMTNGSIRLAVSSTGTHNIHGTATWLY